MTVTLELTADVEQAIERKAKRLGLSTSEYLRRMAERAAQSTPRTTRSRNPKSNADQPKTGADLLAELDALNLPAGYGDPAIDSPELASQLSARFSRSNREGGE